MRVVEKLGDESSTTAEMRGRREQAAASLTLARCVVDAVQVKQDSVKISPSRRMTVDDICRYLPWDKMNSMPFVARVATSVRPCTHHGTFLPTADTVTETWLHFLPPLRAMGLPVKRQAQSVLTMHWSLSRSALPASSTPSKGFGEPCAAQRMRIADAESTKARL